MGLWRNWRPCRCCLQVRSSSMMINDMIKISHIAFAKPGMCVAWIACRELVGLITLRCATDLQHYLLIHVGGDSAKLGCHEDHGWTLLWETRRLDSLQVHLSQEGCAIVPDPRRNCLLDAGRAPAAAAAHVMGRPALRCQFWRVARSSGCPSSDCQPRPFQR